MGKTKERDLQEAINLVENGEFQSRAARGFGVVASTISRRRKGSQPHSRAHEGDQILSNLQEQELTEWILHEERCGRAPAKKIVREFACEIASGLRPVDEAVKIGRNWVDKFLNRHHNLKTKVGRIVNTNRIDGINSKSIKHFYLYVDRTRTYYDIQPEDTYN
jgi:hypothetical protein